MAGGGSADVPYPLTIIVAPFPDCVIFGFHPGFVPRATILGRLAAALICPASERRRAFAAVRGRVRRRFPSLTGSCPCLVCPLLYERTRRRRNRSAGLR